MVKYPSHRTATKLRPWRPRKFTRSLCGRQISEKTLLCVTAIGTVLRTHGDLARDLCVPNCVSTTTSASVRRSYHDLTAPWTRAQCDHRRPYSDATPTQATALRCLGASVASVRRSYGNHRRFAVYLAPFHGKLECFQLIF